MSSSDPRSFNPLPTMDDVRRSIAKAEAEQTDISQSIAKAEAELQTLVFRRKKVTSNISQLRDTLVIHRILPREIIGYIFSILRAEKVSIPLKKDMTPPQITVSHVCSRWREIALATPALWNDVEITKPGCEKWVQVATELFFDRASTQGVYLALDMEQITSLNEMEGFFYNLVLPLRVKKLHLTLRLFALEELSRRVDDIIANIDEIALSLTFDSVPMPNDDDEDQVSIAPRFLSKIRSLTVLTRLFDVDVIRSDFIQDLPWAQMQYLCCNTPMSLYMVSYILSQIPLLNVCGIQVGLDEDDHFEGEPTVLTLPQLRIFHIFIYHFRLQGDQDRVLRSFRCPNLTDFRLEIPFWTPETYKTIENQYNLHRLLRFETRGYPYPISKVLFDAPMLEELIFNAKVFIDERALHGVASRELGRCLTSLGFEGKFNKKRVLEMVASQQRHVKQAVEASRSWQDQQISGIKRIFLLNNNDDVKDIALVEELEAELKKLGVVVDCSKKPLHSHPLSVLGKYGSK